MIGEKDLKILLKNLRPRLCEGRFVFCTLDADDYEELPIEPLGSFREEEGFTVILRKEEADEHRLTYSHVWALITLSVYSDLAAVGLLAVVAGSLASAGISVNVVSAYYHDHLFVLADEAARATALLAGLTFDNR